MQPADHWQEGCWTEAPRPISVNHDSGVAATPDRDKEVLRGTGLSSGALEGQEPHGRARLASCGGVAPRPRARSRRGRGADQDDLQDAAVLERHQAALRSDQDPGRRHSGRRDSDRGGHCLRQRRRRQGRGKRRRGPVPAREGYGDLEPGARHDCVSRHRSHDRRAGERSCREPSNRDGLGHLEQRAGRLGRPPGYAREPGGRSHGKRHSDGGRNGLGRHWRSQGRGERRRRPLPARPGHRELEPRARHDRLRGWFAHDQGEGE